MTTTTIGIIMDNKWHMDNKWQWWSSLDQKWQAVLKEAIGINREPTADELKELFELKKLDLPIPMGLDVRSILKMPNLQFIRLMGNFDHGFYLNPSPHHSKPSKPSYEHSNETESASAIDEWLLKNEFRAFRKYRLKRKKTK